MKLTFKEQVRNIPKDAVYEFDFDHYPTILIAGPNGCGKSTLLNCIRGIKCDNKNKLSLEEGNIKQMSESIELEHSFDHIYHLSSEYDDPLSMDMAYDASAFVESGGFQLKQRSNGERSMGLLSKFLVEHFGQTLEVPKNSLIILDEVDKGFDLQKQVGMHNLVKNINKRTGAKFLYVCHTPIPLMLTEQLYAFKYRMMFPSHDYVIVECGLDVTIKQT